MASQSGGTESGDLFYCLIFWIFLLGFVIRCIFPFFKHFRLRKRSECWNVLFHHFFQFFWRSLWTFNEIQKFHDFITSITRIDFWSNFFFLLKSGKQWCKKWQQNLNWNFEKREKWIKTVFCLYFARHSLKNSSDISRTFQCFRESFMYIFD